ncbi:MAG TPA: glycosyltransferase family 1 protein [Patescibacteria group bacterium]
MHIGIDISAIPYHRGVSRYTANLVRSLSQRKDISLTLYGSSFRQKRELWRFIQTSHLEHLTTRLQSFPPTALSWLWFLGFNPIKKLLPQIEVFHSWDWLQPPDKNLPLVSTIHDLAMLKFPETAHPKILKMHQQAWKVLKKRGAEIIAVSRATKRDIVELLEIPPTKVHVIYEALPQETVDTAESLTDDEHEQIKQRLKLSKPFILFVGTREPRKNLQRLIKAWEQLADKYQLVIAGATGWDKTGRSSQSPHKNLRFLGKVTDKELVVLYSEAEVLAYPSLYEGFGLPILEAFYFGCPVVTSNVSAMPEVAGNAAELVDPLSIASIRQGLMTVLNESEFNQKQRMQKMIIRLHLFNWKKVAEETVEVYRKAVASH